MASQTSHVTLDMLYHKMESLQRDVEIVKYALIPTEKVTQKELKRIRRSISEMELGKKKSLEAVMRGL